MPYIPLQLPPGVVKNGTKYQSKNRWFAADLVRWYEGAMQPISGWSQIPRNDAPDIEAAIGDDGAVFTDYTTAANNATTDDTVILPAVPAIDDAFYFGWSFPFAGVGIFLAQIATSGAGVFEYYNGTTWVDLSTAHNLVDNTEDMAPAGGVDAVYNVTWDIPTDWSTTTINSQGPFYYVRYRATTAHDATVVADYIDLFQTPIYVGEVVRGAAAWRDNSQASYIAFGTPTLLYVFSGSSLWDITPGGFTTGGADAVFTSGAYGGGSYGSGGYGTGDTSQGTITEAQTWQLDSFGEDLVACAYSDGLIYYWDLSVGGGTPAAAVTDSEGADPPIDNLGVVVTPERFVVALGADGDGRYIRWSDQEDANNWTGAAANQAGDFTLPGPGQIQCGLRNRNETLIWTDVDLFSMRYIGGNLVYSFAQVGANSGIISRHAKAGVDGRVYYMGHRGFFQYDGFAKPIACSIADEVFNDINRLQKSKISAFSVSEYREIWFCYPSAGSTENDKVAVYNYVEDYWTGPWDLERLSGVDRGAFDYPIAFDSLGQVYYHEIADSYLVPDRTSSLSPSAESGPIELGQGDQSMSIMRVIPDEDSLGDVDLTLYAAAYPTQAVEDEQAITTLTEPTSARLTGRQVRVKVITDQTGWRLGVLRLEVRPRGRR
jgi:hypothetical protein